jgi:hypothetical protein
MANSIVTASALDVRVRNGEAARAHIEAEIADNVDGIMATLVPHEPYAYTVIPIGHPAGSIPHQKFVSSRADLRTSYETLHRFAASCPMQSIAEIRGDWYVFLHGVAEGRLKDTGQSVYAQTVVLFPTMGQAGITGELLWNRSGVGPPFTGGREGALSAEIAVLERHKALIEGLRNADAGAVAALFHPDAQIGIRDYVNDTGRLAAMHGAGELREYLEQFFARYHVRDISLMQRLAGDWFVFDEMLWIVEDRMQPGLMKSWYTAEHSEVLSNGLLASRIGHGTDARRV